MPPDLRSAGVGSARSRRVAFHKLLRRQVRLHDTIGLEAISVGVVHAITNGIDLLAHGVGHHGDLAACARFPNAPGHRVERRHAHKPHLKCARDALRRRHGDAYTGERARAAADAHARDVPARDPVFGK